MKDIVEDVRSLIEQTETTVRSLIEQKDTLRAENNRMHDELSEQCRINGMGSEREAALLSKVARLEHQVAILEHAIEAARVAMTAAPLWHEQHRAAWDALRKLEETK